MHRWNLKDLLSFQDPELQLYAKAVTQEDNKHGR